MPSYATLGKEFKLYLDTEIPYSGSPTWAEVENVRDLTRNLEKALADASIRGTDFRQQRGTLKDFSLDFQMVHDPYDDLLMAIEDAFYSDRNLLLAAIDGPIEEDGHHGIMFMGQVTKFGGNEGLEEIGTHDVTIVVGFDSVNKPHRCKSQGGELVNA